MDNDQLEDPEDLINKTIEEIDNKQKDLDNLSEKLGATKQQLIDAKPWILNLYEVSVQDQSLREVTISGSHLIYSSFHEVRNLQPNLDLLDNRVNHIAGTIDAFLSSSDATAQYYPEAHHEYIYKPNPYLIIVDESNLSDRLAKLDHVLGEEHEGAWAIYYSSKPDKNRLALFQMRQLYDNIFRKLSPDDDVRKSEYWHPKEGDKQNQVYREERIQYAAFTHVKDKERASTLVASARHIKDVYDLLNKAHDEKPIEAEYAKQALDSMDKIFQQWLDALEL